MPAHLSLILLHYLVFYGPFLLLLATCLAATHTSHRVIVLILLAGWLVELALIWGCMRHVDIVITDRCSHDIHLLLELLVQLDLLLDLV